MKKWRLLFFSVFIVGSVHAFDYEGPIEKPIEGPISEPIVTYHKLPPAQPGGFHSYYTTEEITQQINTIDIISNPEGAFNLLNRLNNTPSARQFVSIAIQKMLGQIDRMLQNISESPETVFSLLKKFENNSDAQPIALKIKQRLENIISARINRFNASDPEKAFKLIEEWTGQPGAEEFLAPLIEKIKQEGTIITQLLSSDPSTFFERLQTWNALGKQYPATALFADELIKTVTNTVGNALEDENFPFDNDALNATKLPQWVTILREWHTIPEAEVFVNYIKNQISNHVNTVISQRVDQEQIIMNAIKNPAAAPATILNIIDQWNPSDVMNQLDNLVDDPRHAIQNFQRNYADPIAKVFFRLNRNAPELIPAIAENIKKVLPTEYTEIQNFQLPREILLQRFNQALIKYDGKLSETLTQYRLKLIETQEALELQKQLKTVSREEQGEITESASPPAAKKTIQTPTISEENPVGALPSELQDLVNDFSETVRQLKTLSDPKIIKTMFSQPMSDYIEALQSDDPIEKSEAIENAENLASQIEQIKSFFPNTILTRTFKSLNSVTAEVIKPFMGEIELLLSHIGQDFKTEIQGQQTETTSGQRQIQAEELAQRSIVRKLVSDGRLNSWLEKQGFSDPFIRSKIVSMIDMVNKNPNLSKLSTDSISTVSPTVIQNFLKTVFETFGISDIPAGKNAKPELLHSANAVRDYLSDMSDSVSQTSLAKNFFSDLAKSFTPTQLLLERLIKNPLFNSFEPKEQLALINDTILKNLYESISPESIKLYDEILSQWKDISATLPNEPSITPAQEKKDLATSTPDQINQDAQLFVEGLTQGGKVNIPPTHAAEFPSLLDEINQLLGQELPDQKQIALRNFRTAITWAMMEDAAQKASVLLSRANEGFAQAGQPEIQSYIDDASVVKKALENAISLYKNNVIPLTETPVILTIINAQMPIETLASSLEQLTKTIDQSLPEQPKEEPIPEEPSTDVTAKQPEKPEEPPSKDQTAAEYVTGQTNLTPEQQDLAIVSWVEMQQELDSALRLITRVQDYEDNPSKQRSDITPKELKFAQQIILEHTSLYDDYITGKQKQPSAEEIDDFKELFDQKFDIDSSPTLVQLGQQLQDAATQIGEHAKLLEELEKPAEEPTESADTTKQETPQEPTHRVKTWLEIEQDLATITEKLKQEDINSKSGIFKWLAKAIYWLKGVFTPGNFAQLITAVNNLIKTAASDSNQLQRMNTATTLEPFLNDLQVYTQAIVAHRIEREATKGLSFEQLNTFSENVTKLQNALKALTKSSVTA